MRTPWVAAACAGAAVVLGPGRAWAQVSDELDPCKDAVSAHEQSACWTQQADNADAAMKETLDELAAKLPPRAATELRKAQKAWLEFRGAHLAMLYATDYPDGRSRMEGLTCSAIARRQLTLARTRELKRLLKPAGDEACRL